MRIGLTIGPQRGRYHDKVAQLIAGGRAAERAGFPSVWIPQYPDDFDAKVAEGALRPAPWVVASMPMTLCRADEVDAVRQRANTGLRHAEYSPNYQQLLDRGDAADVADICAAGDEAAVIQRLRRVADAGATDMGVRVLAYGPSRDERIASGDRTIAFLSSLAPELR